MVGDFISRKPRRRRHRARRLEQIGGGIAIGNDDPPRSGFGREARARLDRQLIEREMLGAEGERAGEFGFPGGQRLAGAGVDKVEADARKGGLRGVERGEALGHIMRAAEKGERAIVKRLQPERHAVDPGARNIGKARRLDRGGIRLQRDFDIWLGGPVHGGGVDHCRDRLGRHQRRRAATEEDRAEPSPRQRLRFISKVGEQRVTPRRLIDAFTDMAVKVAIGTFRDAEWPMDIKRQRRR
ncbi:hypothetical protein D9M73_138170 [compost metagenome]